VSEPLAPPFQIFPMPRAIIAALCATCDGHHIGAAVALRSHTTAVKIIEFCPWFRHRRGALLTWYCKGADCDASVPILPTLLTAAKDGLWPVRVITNPAGRLKLAYTGMIFAPARDIANIAANRVVAHAPLKGYAKAAVQCATDVGASENALSAELLADVLKAVLMHRAVRDDLRLQSIRPLNLGPCPLCARVPSSLGTGCVHTMYDFTSTFKQTEAQGQRAKNRPHPDDAVLSAVRSVLLPEEKLTTSYLRSVLGCSRAVGTGAPGGTPASASAVHGHASVRGETADACAQARTCEGTRVHIADRGLVLPLDYDPDKESHNPFHSLGTAQCRHLFVSAAVASSTAESATHMYALIDAVMSADSFSPAMFTDLEWPELLRNRLFNLGHYDVGCRFKIWLEERYSLRYEKEEIEMLRQLFLRRVGIVPVDSEQRDEEVGEGAAPSGEPCAPDAAPPKPMRKLTWRQRLAATVNSNRKMSGLPFDMDFCVGAFHIWGHDWGCQELNGQFRKPGTGLTQGDGPEGLNAFLLPRAANTRSLSRVMLDASVDAYLRYYNEFRFEHLVPDLATRAKAAHAKYLVITAQLQALADLDGRTFSVDEVNRFRKEVLAAASSLAGKPDVAVISGNPIATAAEALHAAKAYLDALTAFQSFGGVILPDDGKFDPSNPKITALLAIFAGMRVAYMNNFNGWNAQRIANTLRATATRVCKLSAALLAQCRKLAAITHVGAPFAASTLGKLARAKCTTTEAFKLQAEAITVADSEAGAKRHQLVKEWLLDTFKSLRAARVASSKHASSTSLKAKVRDALQHVTELMGMHNCHIAVILADGGVSAEAPLDVALLSSPEFDMSTYITTILPEVTSTGALSFRKKQEQVHLQDMLARIREELFLLGKEVGHLPHVLRYTESHLISTMQQQLQHSYVDPSAADTGSAFHTSLVLTAVKRQLEAHPRKFTNWECLPATEDECREPEMDRESHDGDVRDPDDVSSLDDDAVSECAQHSDVDSDDGTVSQAGSWLEDSREDLNKANGARSPIRVDLDNEPEPVKETIRDPVLYSGDASNPINLTEAHLSSLAPKEWLCGEARPSAACVAPTMRIYTQLHCAHRCR
jgi:hypothetical protein